MNWRRVVRLTVYVLMTGAITYFYFAAGEIFLGVAAPFLSGVIIAIFAGLRVRFQNFTREDVRGEIWISGILIVAPVLWYLAFGCVFGCLG